MNTEHINKETGPNTRNTHLAEIIEHITEETVIENIHLTQNTAVKGLDLVQKTHDKHRTHQQGDWTWF